MKELIVYEKRWFVKNGSKLFGIITQVNRVETINHACNKKCTNTY